MINREAIEMLKAYIKANESICIDMEFPNMYERQNQALEMGIQALEKQEPKKPRQLGNSRYLCCVECGNNVKTHWLGCPHCLTPIDWGE